MNITFPYQEGDGRTARPVVPFKLGDPLGLRSLDLTVGVDTGFDGGLLLPFDAYLELGLQEFEESSAPVGRTAQGIAVRLRESRGVVTLQGEGFPSRVFTTPLLLRPLLGLELLKLWGAVFDGPRAELSLSSTPTRKRA